MNELEICERFDVENIRKSVSYKGSSDIMDSEKG